MKVVSATGKTGFLLNPYHEGGAWVFRVYENGTFTDYKLYHSDLCVTIIDEDASFYTDEENSTLDHSLETLGLKL
jgi:hypothetical protein